MGYYYVAECDCGWDIDSRNFPSHDEFMAAVRKHTNKHAEGD